MFETVSILVDERQGVKAAEAVRDQVVAPDIAKVMAARAIWHGETTPATPAEAVRDAYRRTLELA